MNELFTVLDFETTGLDANEAQVTELAAKKYDAEGNCVGTIHTFVQLTEGREPSPYAKVTKEDCATGLNEINAMQLLASFLDGSTVVAQYAPFDFSFLSKHGYTPGSFICTRALTHLVEPGENPSLSPTVERLGLEVLDAHRALDDVLMTKEVFFKQKERADQQELAYRNVVVDFAKRPLRFTPAHATIIKEQ